MQEKLTRIAENSVALYDRCHKNHYAITFTGDGTSQMQFAMPFEPDAVQLLCSDPRIMFQNNGLMFINIDYSGLGMAGGVVNLLRNGKVINTAMTTTTVFNRVTYGDGVLTISGSVDDFVFVKDLEYRLVATKLTDKTYRQRYEEFVESLTGSGTAQVCKTKIEAAFTTDEWTALKATRPDWIFKEV